MNIAETQQMLDRVLAIELRVKTLSAQFQLATARIHELELEAAQRRGPGSGAETPRETLSLNKNRPVNGTR